MEVAPPRKPLSQYTTAQPSARTLQGTAICFGEDNNDYRFPLMRMAGSVHLHRAQAEGCVNKSMLTKECVANMTFSLFLFIVKFLFAFYVSCQGAAKRRKLFYYFINYFGERDEQNKGGMLFICRWKSSSKHGTHLQIFCQHDLYFIRNKSINEPKMSTKMFR